MSSSSYDYSGEFEQDRFDTESQSSYATTESRSSYTTNDTRSTSARGSTHTPRDASHHSQRQSSRSEISSTSGEIPISFKPPHRRSSAVDSHPADRRAPVAADRRAPVAADGRRPRSHRPSRPRPDDDDTASEASSYYSRKSKGGLDSRGHRRAPAESLPSVGEDGQYSVYSDDEGAPDGQITPTDGSESSYTEGDGELTPTNSSQPIYTDGYDEPGGSESGDSESLFSVDLAQPTESESSRSSYGTRTRHVSHTAAPPYLPSGSSGSSRSSVRDPSGPPRRPRMPHSPAETEHPPRRSRGGESVLSADPRLSHMTDTRASQNPRREHGQRPRRDVSPAPTEGSGTSKSSHRTNSGRHNPGEFAEPHSHHPDPRRNSRLAALRPDGAPTPTESDWSSSAGDGLEDGPEDEFSDASSSYFTGSIVTDAPMPTRAIPLDPRRQDRMPPPPADFGRGPIPPRGPPSSSTGSSRSSRHGPHGSHQNFQMPGTAPYHGDISAERAARSIPANHIPLPPFKDHAPPPNVPGPRPGSSGNIQVVQPTQPMQPNSANGRATSSKQASATTHHSRQPASGAPAQAGPPVRDIVLLRKNLMAPDKRDKILIQPHTPTYVVVDEIIGRAIAAIDCSNGQTKLGEVTEMIIGDCKKYSISHKYPIGRDPRFGHMGECMAQFLKLLKDGFARINLATSRKHQQQLVRVEAVDDENKWSMVQDTDFIITSWSPAKQSKVWLESGCIQTLIDVDHGDDVKDLYTFMAVVKLVRAIASLLPHYIIGEPCAGENVADHLNKKDYGKAFEKKLFGGSIEFFCGPSEKDLVAYFFESDDKDAKGTKISPEYMRRCVGHGSTDKASYHKDFYPKVDFDLKRSPPKDRHSKEKLSKQYATRSRMESKPIVDYFRAKKKAEELAKDMVRGYSVVPPATPKARSNDAGKKHHGHSSSSSHNKNTTNANKNGKSVMR